MNSFQSTAINVNFFTGAVTSGRFASGGASASSGAPVNDASNLDANQLALERLRDALQGSGVQLNPNAQPRSATDVATQVLNRIQTALEAAPDNEARIALLKTAAEGIAQGIGEARQILDKTDGVNTKAGETVGAIAEQLQTGLQALADGIVADTPTNRAVVPVQNQVGNSAGTVAESPAAELATSSQLSVGAASLIQRSASISIQTQDGDVVTLDFNRSAATVVTVEAQVASDGASASVTAVRAVSADLNFSVQGELDQGEVDALDALLGKINQVADKFFGGQLSAAFQKASNLELNTEELSGYSIALENILVQQAVGNYQQVAGLSDLGTGAATGADSTNSKPSPAPVSTPVQPVRATPNIADAATAVSELAQVVDFAGQQRVIADPQTTVPNLIETVARAKGFDTPSNPAGQTFAEAIGLLRNLIADLVLPGAAANEANTGGTESDEVETQDEQGQDRDDN